jgi:hypothetical protein
VLSGAVFEFGFACVTVSSDFHVPSSAVLEKIDFYPDGIEAFSTDGCRPVYARVADHLAHHRSS